MCRLLAYLGDEAIRPGKLLYHAKNSLIKQSMHASESEYVVNGDGFGMSWYHTDFDPEPARFRSTQPAWNDRNLLEMIDKFKTKYFFAHVRAATHGVVNQLNCHPFTYKQFSFMHNGYLHGFKEIKRALINELGDERFHWLQGLTDSEHIAALFYDELFKLAGEERVAPDKESSKCVDVELMHAAMMTTLDKLMFLKKQAGVTNGISHLNFCVGNGKTLMAIRFTDDPKGSSASLYYAAGKKVEYQGDGYRISPSQGKNGSVLIASERLTKDLIDWHEVPVNNVVLVDETLAVEVKRI